MKPRIIALYLPQFHPIPENDEWWGKGFTDWVNVKAARPLFKGHMQPKVPLNDNYYDLTDVETLRWQASLANKYNIYGMCIYHYWFRSKMLLQKPAEILLKNKDIPMNFCFSWANEPWARTWDGKAHEILIDQDYGDEEDWEAHFQYLLPFFKDDRYIKEDGCPMFIIYKSRSIPRLKKMMKLWDKLAKKNGLKGMFFVNTIREKKVDKRDLPFKAQFEFEPARTNYNRSTIYLNFQRSRRLIIKTINKLLHTKKPINKPLSFSSIAKKSLALKSQEGTYGGVFTGWDNTPRRCLSASIILPPTKQEFKDYLIKKIDITTNIYKTNYIFVNAWNEWAEGAVLEPDEVHKYQYLEAIKEVSEKL